MEGKAKTESIRTGLETIEGDDSMIAMTGGNSYHKLNQVEFIPLKLRALKKHFPQIIPTFWNKI